MFRHDYPKFTIQRKPVYTQSLLSMHILQKLNGLSHEMIGVLSHDSELVRLYWAGDNLD